MRNVIPHNPSPFFFCAFEDFFFYDIGHVEHCVFGVVDNWRVWYGIGDHRQNALFNLIEQHERLRVRENRV